MVRRRERHVGLGVVVMPRAGPLRADAGQLVEQPDQPTYLNQMLLLETTMAPRDLMHAGQAIEEANGRVRLAHWGSRTLDIDIVRYGDLHLTEPDLVLPHPGLALRDFWQREIAELDAHEQ